MMTDELQDAIRKASSDDEVKATVVISHSGLNKAFTTCNRLQKNKMIEMRLLEGPFKHLEGFWRFDILDERACKVSLDLEFEFKNRLIGLPSCRARFLPLGGGPVRSLAGDRSARAGHAVGLRALHGASFDLLGMNDCRFLVGLFHLASLSSSVTPCVHSVCTALPGGSNRACSPVDHLPRARTRPSRSITAQDKPVPCCTPRQTYTVQQTNAASNDQGPD